MIKLSNTKLISILIKLVVLSIVAKIIALIVGVYVGGSGVEFSETSSYQPKYQRINFKNMIDYKTKVKVNKPQINDGISITNMILKGLYGTSSKGFVIVAMKSNPDKTSIVGIGEEYKGYKLTAIFAKGVKFRKNGLDFMLYLEKRNNTHTSKSSLTSSVLQSEIQTKVSRNDILYFAKNPKEIWKNISLKEVREHKKIKGFMINRINKNSVFARLGLKRGDLIVEVNNMEIKSYREALSVYKNIDILDSIQIVVMRNNQEVELVYEIN